MKRDGDNALFGHDDQLLHALGHVPKDLEVGHGIVGAKDPDVLDHHRLDLGGGSLVDRLDHAPIVCKAKEEVPQCLRIAVSLTCSQDIFGFQLLLLLPLTIAIYGNYHFSHVLPLSVRLNKMLMVTVMCSCK